MENGRNMKWKKYGVNSDNRMTNYSTNVDPDFLFLQIIHVSLCCDRSHLADRSEKNRVITLVKCRCGLRCKQVFGHSVIDP